MSAKLTLICLIHSVNEKDSTNYIIRETISVIRKEDNTSIDLKITSFISNLLLLQSVIPIFVFKNILKLIGKFTLKEKPSHDILKVINFIFNLFLL